MAENGIRINELDPNTTPALTDIVPTQKANGSDVKTTLQQIASLTNASSISDPNTATATVCILNGWSSDLKNAPAEAKNGNHMLITAWQYNSHYGVQDDSKFRTQTLILQSGRIYYRQFMQTQKAWGEWTTFTEFNKDLIPFLTPVSNNYDIESTGSYIQFQTSNSSNNSLVQASQEHLYMLVCTSKDGANYQIAQTVSGNVYTRAYRWWDNKWEVWRKVKVEQPASDIRSLCTFASGYTHQAGNIWQKDDMIYLSECLNATTTTAAEQVALTLPVNVKFGYINYYDESLKHNITLQVSTGNQIKLPAHSAGSFPKITGVLMLD